MYNDRNRVAEEIKGDSSSRQIRLILKMLEEIRAEIRFIRHKLEKEEA